MSDYNPYEPPKADLRPSPEPVSQLVLLPEPRSLPLSAGIAFWSASWRMVKSNLGMWILITVLLFALQVVLRFAISQTLLWGGYLLVLMVASVISTVLTGGILIGARAVADGQSLQIEHLFAGFGSSLKPLVLLGVVSFGLSQLVEYLVKAVIGIDMDGLANGTVLPTEILSGIAPEQIALVVILYLLVMMLSWFTAPLVVLNDVPVLQAFVLSFKGCLRNPLALIVYALVLMLLIVLGAIPLMLGLLVVIPLPLIVLGAMWLLVVIPWWFMSIYVSYRQIFLT